MSRRLDNKRVVVTCADKYMGPAIETLFKAEGAEVQASTDPLIDQESVDGVLSTCGDIDVLIANLVEPPHLTPVDEIEDADWFVLFDKLVHPLMRLVRGITPRLKAQGSGKIIAVTSAAPLVGISRSAGYCAARGAQNAFIRSVGLELARSNIQVNAIAQNYVSNDTYYSDDLVNSEKFQAHLQKFVPRRQVADSEETAELALYLSLGSTRHMIGQVIPFAGGWA
jgi:2-keto-3-deoxy-L-fuconate dehydrogenase